MRDGSLHASVSSSTFCAHLTLANLERFVKCLYLDAHFPQLLIHFLRSHRGVHIIGSTNRTYIFRLMHSSLLLLLDLWSIFLVIGEGALTSARVELIAPWSRPPHHVLSMAGSLCAQQGDAFSMCL